jgi:hypothetical protein
MDTIWLPKWTAPVTECPAFAPCMRLILQACNLPFTLGR